MEIYIVLQGDTVYSIAEKFGVDVERLVTENGLEHPYNLVVGQTIVITFPQQIHIVQHGESLESIAEKYNVTVMQLLRNNSFLSGMELLYPGVTLVIKYNVKRSITTTGFTFPFIKHDILRKTLPNLTYLSIFNYKTTVNADIIAYYDDTDIIKMAKDYGVVPLLLLSILTLQGEPDVETAFSILVSVEAQEKNINAFIDIMKNKGYLGINIVFNTLNQNNQSLVFNYIKRISEHLKKENLLLFVTINYNEDILNEQIDYSQLVKYSDNLLLIKLVWGINYGPPAPVSNINIIRSLINNVASVTALDSIIIGKSIIGYDWKLPYIVNKTIATSLTIPSILALAYDNSSIIQFDEDSKTPYFFYNETNIGFPFQHIVWFIDARSINVLLDIIIEYNLNGSGIWNIMVFNNQLWTLINSQFDIVKII